MCDDVKLVVFVYLIAALSYAVVAFAQRHFVLYGRRKFVFTIVVAVTLRAILGFAYPFLPFEALILHGIGVVVPALLANQFSRQGIPLTAVSSLAVDGPHGGRDERPVLHGESRRRLWSATACSPGCAPRASRPERARIPRGRRRRARAGGRLRGSSA